MNLRQSLPSRFFALACGYVDGGLDARVAACSIGADDSLAMDFARPHPFRAGDPVTVHLDDRTGAELLDINFHVWRGSYRGRAVQVDVQWMRVEPLYFEMYHGNRLMLSGGDPGYRHPEDGRSDKELALARGPLDLPPDSTEGENKLGILVTRSPGWPHTTVMAFLSTVGDDIFLISHRGSFKSRMLHRDPRCVFVIDHRASWLFEKKFDWNFTAIESVAELVAADSPDFGRIQAEFVEKNPWELPFFSDPKAELFHLRAERLLCDDSY